MKTALITGTSTGIGLATAVAFAGAGFKVYATMRDPAKATALLATGAAVEIVQLDVQDPASIAAAVAHCGRIDVLINNAGSGFLGTTEQTSEAELQRVFDVNFFGAWRVTQAFLPAMREARQGRIIGISSIGGIHGQPFNDAYCAAKFAMEGWLESLASVMIHFGVHVSLVEPGPVLTAFAASVESRLPDLSADPYHEVQAVYFRNVKERFASLGQTPAEVAAVILEAATAERPHMRYQTSERMRDRAAQKLADPSGNAVLAATAASLSK
ncbi:MAG: short-chain dehydrogenase/reductase [Cyanobacteria bacterium RYN_339]|nr:short-chain dehydrogenase/reductase [Cyanobacteria bacterium RYN_339]